MAETQPEPPPNSPYGTHPRRSSWPLVLLIMLFAAWFVVLVWLAVQYPAR